MTSLPTPVDRQREWFDDDAFWRELYSCIFTPARFEEAYSEVDRLLALTRPADRAVLDLCCGPGRCAIELARRGYAVTGVDRTEFLLEKARERARTARVEVEWVRADMRDFVRPAAFDLVLNMFTSFGYFDESEEDLAVLGRMLRSLRPGGSCLIDVIGKECLARMFQPVTSEVLADGTRVVRSHEIRDDWTRYHAAWTVTRDGESKTFRYSHTIYSGRELRERMERAGFVDVRLFGSLDGIPYGPDAACLVAVGRRPTAPLSRRPSAKTAGGAR